MSILVWIVFGLVIGLLARLVMPGRQPMGLIMTTLLGIAGSLIGGIVGSLLQYGHVEQISGAGFLGSLIGAVVLLALFGLVRRGPGTPIDRPVT